MDDEKEAIRELFYRECQYVDEGNAEAWASLFVTDGVFDVGIGGIPPQQGQEALRAFATAFRPGAALHVTVNPVITLDGDEATADSTFLVIGGAGGPGIMMAGRYADRLRLVGEEWRFVSRRLAPIFQPGG